MTCLVVVFWSRSGRAAHFSHLAVGVARQTLSLPRPVLLIVPHILAHRLRRNINNGE
jgi:hypothetical protein